MRALVCALAIVLLLSPPSSSGEPSALLDASAKTVERKDMGSTTRVRVELSLTSKIDLPSVRIRASRAGKRGIDEELGIADRVLTLRRNAGRKLVYDLELVRGSMHHVFFHVESLDRHGSSAYLRINLDPTLEPEDLGSVLQYRAKMADGDGR